VRDKNTGISTHLEVAPGEPFMKIFISHFIYNNTMQTTTLAPANRAESFTFDRFSFGETPTDHLFVAEYKNGNWMHPAVRPFSNFSLHPFSLCFHYGQTVFEGMKAFRLADGNISIFRPDKHYERLSRSLERMCMPALPEELFMQGLTTLLRQDQAWLPAHNEHVALYIRPFVIATEARLGVKISDDYLFIITCTPIRAYYDRPLKVKVETAFARAAEGGSGYAKCGGNYGGAFYATQKAKEEGFDQVIWTDAATHQYLEEAGTMNIMLVVNDTLVTPALNDSILDGITRSSLLQLARDLHFEVEERPVSSQEIAGYLQNGERLELFGVGTAAIVSPIACVQIEGTAYYPYTGDDAFMFTLKDELEAIRRGLKKDVHGWNHLVDG
jgi:branched-chain amino acid aminotransferase